jgi:hypothetical protein
MRFKRPSDCEGRPCKTKTVLKPSEQKPTKKASVLIQKVEAANNLRNKVILKM